MSYHNYIIVGAGPAGLQMGYFFEQANRDYIILEANDTPGSFFATQPRHRTLLSINKRFNYYTEPEFNMRHDWNSLLTDDYSFLFRNYSEKLYPDADELYRYLMDFSEEYNLKIQLNTRVKTIAHKKKGPANFILTDEAGREYTCSCLLVGTGPTMPNIPTEIEGIELAAGYEDHEIDPKYYENKRILIIGRGNSAFEVANHLAGHAAIIHIAIGNRPVDLAWQTHFVGHVRSINNTVLEMLHVKALHAALGFNVQKLTKQADGTIKAEVTEEVPNWPTPSIVRNEVVYDHVIRCTGWKYVNPSLFSPETMPEIDAWGKYPVLNSSWESSVPNLFFIGTSMAARDRKSASSFIHGFRYNIRTLFNLLEERYESKALPRKHFRLQDENDLEVLAKTVLKRVTVSDALYQLFGFLGDVLRFSDGKVEYFRELPLEHALERADFTDGQEILTITLEYGFHNYTETNALNFITVFDDDANRRSGAAYLHPILRHYVNGELVEETHLDESLDIRYDRPTNTPTNGKKSISIDLSNARQNIVMNAINKVAKVTSETFPEEIYGPSNRILPWPADRPVDEYIKRYKRPVRVAARSERL